MEEVMTSDSERIIPEFSDSDFKVSSFTEEKSYCVEVVFKDGDVEEKHEIISCFRPKVVLSKKKVLFKTTLGNVE